MWRSLERKGYNCGDKIGVDKFYARRALMCGHWIEYTYYNPNAGTKCGTIVTEGMCALYYVNDDLVTPNELMKSLNLSVKDPLTICRGCFESGIKPPSSGGRTNVRQAAQQDKVTKKRKLGGAVKAGRRKAIATT